MALWDSQSGSALLPGQYYQASTTIGKQGAGLGYCFSRLVVQAHGGHISAINRVGGGLVVTLRLPRAK